MLQRSLRSGQPELEAAKASAWHVIHRASFVTAVARVLGQTDRGFYNRHLIGGSAPHSVAFDAGTGTSRPVIAWNSNHYLGLHRDEDVIKAGHDALDRYGTGTGTSTAGGALTEAHLEFEKEFADWVGKPAACLFSTGYAANVGALTGLLSSSDVVVLDRLCHASLVDGARLSGARVRSFRHNDVQSLPRFCSRKRPPLRRCWSSSRACTAWAKRTAR